MRDFHPLNLTLRQIFGTEIHGRAWMNEGHKKWWISCAESGSSEWDSHTYRLALIISSIEPFSFDQARLIRHNQILARNGIDPTGHQFTYPPFVHSWTRLFPQECPWTRKLSRICNSHIPIPLSYSGFSVVLLSFSHLYTKCTTCTTWHPMQSWIHRSLFLVILLLGYWHLLHLYTHFPSWLIHCSHPSRTESAVF